MGKKECNIVSKYYIQLKYFNLQKIWNCEFHIFRYKISPQDVGPYNLYSCRYLSEFHIYSYKTSPQDVGPYNFYSCKYVTLNLNLYQCPLYIITYHLVKLLSLKTTSLTIFTPPYLRQGNIIAHNAFSYEFYCHLHKLHITRISNNGHIYQLSFNFQQETRQS